MFAFFEKNASSQTVITVRIAPKICQGWPPPPPTFGSHCSRSHPNRFTFGGVIAERIKTVLLHRVFTIYYLRAYNNNNADIDSRFVFEQIAVETLGVFDSSARLLLDS